MSRSPPARLENSAVGLANCRNWAYNTSWLRAAGRVAAVHLEGMFSPVAAARFRMPAVHTADFSAVFPRASVARGRNMPSRALKACSELLGFRPRSRFVSPAGGWESAGSGSEALFAVSRSPEAFGRRKASRVVA